MPSWGDGRHQGSDHHRWRPASQAGRAPHCRTWHRVQHPGTIRTRILADMPSWADSFMPSLGSWPVSRFNPPRLLAEMPSWADCFFLRLGIWPTAPRIQCRAVKARWLGLQCKSSRSIRKLRCRSPHVHRQPVTSPTPHRCSSRPLRRAIVRSLPMISADSNSGGDTRRPESAVRTGPNARRGL